MTPLPAHEAPGLAPFRLSPEGSAQTIAAVLAVPLLRYHLKAVPLAQTPREKARTECDCHPVASIISGIVAPRLAFRSVMTAAAFEPGRDGGAGDADFAGVTALDFVFGVRAMTASPSWAPARCRRSHYPKPREPRGEPLFLPTVCTRRPTAHSNASRALEVQSDVRIRSQLSGAPVRGRSQSCAVIGSSPRTIPSSGVSAPLGCTRYRESPV